MHKALVCQVRGEGGFLTEVGLRTGWAAEGSTHV